jgi:hypothetical protein
MYWHDVNQDDKIITLFKTNNCLEINNYKSKYIGLCKDNILIVNDYFSLDLSTNITINYNDIIKISDTSKEILIGHQQTTRTLYFETELKKQSYLSMLNKKLKAKERI